MGFEVVSHERRRICSGNGLLHTVAVRLDNGAAPTACDVAVRVGYCPLGYGLWNERYSHKEGNVWEYRFETATSCD